MLEQLSVGKGIRMPATKIAIFYTTSTGVLQGVLVPDDDSDLDRCYAPKGETMLIISSSGSFVDRDGKPTLANAHRYILDQITAATGFPPSNPICAVVNDQGAVEGMIHAEEGVHILPGKTLVSRSK